MGVGVGVGSEVGVCVGVADGISVAVGVLGSVGTRVPVITADTVFVGLFTSRALASDAQPLTNKKPSITNEKYQICFFANMETILPDNKQLTAYSYY